MKNLFRILLSLSLLAVAIACEPAPEPEVIPAASITISEVTASESSASFVLTIANADKAAYLVSAEGGADKSAGAGLETSIFQNGTAVEFNSEASFTEPQSVTINVANLEAGKSYTVSAAASNKSGEVSATPANFSTAEPEPEPEPKPENPVYMSDIEITSIVAHSVEFSVTTRNMDDFGFVVIPTAEFAEMTAEEIVAASETYYWADGNLSWEQDFTFPFNFDTVASTDYTVAAAAINSESQVVKVATFSTPAAEMTVEKISFKPTKISVIHDGNDHFLTMSTALYELQLHLVGEGFGGRYDNNDTLEQGFVAEGTHFKKLNPDESWTTYDQVDANIGNVDLYENVVTGKWEVFGSFCFAIPNKSNGWLTIEIELNNGVVITGAERTEPAVLNITPTSGEAVQDESNKSIWYLTLTQDKNNTITFEIKLDSSKYEYIPTGDYYNDGLGAPCLNGASMIVNNVATSLGKKSVGLSELHVEYDAATGESYVSATAYVAAGTAVAEIAKCGPFKFYEEAQQELEVVEESRNLMIWATWMPSMKAWELNFMGDAFYGYLYFVTGADSSAYLPEGRYTFAKSAPADGSMWIDCNSSYVAKLRTSEEMKFLTDAEGAYFDVTTTTDGDGNYLHTIVGTIHTENGFYRINFDYGLERGTIY